MADVSLNWSNFKTQVDRRSLTIQYVVGNSAYYLIAFDNLMQLTCLMPMDGGADQLDFENNYRTNGNYSNRLKVDALISSTSSGISSTLSKNYKFNISTTPIGTNATTYSTVYNYSGSGLFYGYQLVCDNTHIQMRLTIDGVVIFDFDGNMLGSFSGLLGNSEQSQAGLFFNQSGNNFDFSPRYPIPYNATLKIEVKSSDSSTHHVNAWFLNSTKEA